MEGSNAKQNDEQNLDNEMNNNPNKEERNYLF